MQDSFGRNINYLRVSVTESCNLRCIYCMPSKGIKPAECGEILSNEELFRIIRIMSDMGIEKVRFTGGEPLERKNIFQLFENVNNLPKINITALTTNGVLLSKYADYIKKCGVSAVNVSLDTLTPEIFSYITRAEKSLHRQILDGIKKLLSLGIKVKINCVPINGYNDSSVEDIAELAKLYPIDVRFIELMPMGMGKMYKGLSEYEILARLVSRYGKFKSVQDSFTSSPAKYFRFEGFCGNIGLISPISKSFCENCSRVRLTADGRLKLCLYYDCGVDLKPLIRSGASDEKIADIIKDTIIKKPKEHNFEHMQENYCNEEKRMMNRIGG